MQIKPLVKDFLPPIYGSLGAAAFDVIAQEDGIIQRHAAGLIKLGFAAAIPSGFVGIIAPRSGMGVKEGVGLRNTIGVIDSDYRGEWMVSLKCDSLNHHGSLRFKRGDRIAQVMILPVAQVPLEIVEELDDTSRGEGGFGSTGK